ncbi:hypothetical protein ABFT23_21235 [Nocardioides sp. C4-1]|uniref:hypothetical protein n=1 Tax=Nocardioides sp. C4-1 TaxID=3151851 RepID=UPI0032671E26
MSASSPPDGACPRCGTPRSGPGEQFCPVCDTFLAWHAPATDEVAAPPAPAADEAGPPTVPFSLPGQPPAPPRPSADAPRRPPDRVRPPVVSTDTAEVEVAPLVPGTFPLALRNGSSIVDSYEVVVADPPPWLAIQHGDTNLLPEESRTVSVTLSVRPETLALAQRLPVVVRVRSTVDPGRVAEVPLTVVVPLSGPPATLVAHPSLVRLQDAEHGAFGLRLDNRASNHPRTYRFSVSDPEGVVRVDLQPLVAQVPAGGTVDVAARFVSPAPGPGEQSSRQLSITATDEQGPVTTQVTVTQETAAVRERVPLKLRLEPSQVVLAGGTTARVDVVVDNRANGDDAVVTLRGRDPAGVLGFRFDHTGFTVGAGRAVRLGVTVTAPPAPRGQSVTRPFSVVAQAAGLESEIDGRLELSSRQAAIASAAVHVQPAHLVTSSRRGEFAVDVDNRQGGEPLHVVLSAADEFGRARIGFHPVQLSVPPGQVARSTMTVTHDRPDGGTSETRRLRVTASSGPDAVHGEATFTQEADSHRRLWAVLLGLLGTLTAVAGVLVHLRDATVGGIRFTVEALVDETSGGGVPDELLVRANVQLLCLALVLLTGVLMLISLTGTTGTGLRRGAVAVVLLGVGTMVAIEDVTLGLGLVVSGAVVAFVGGVLLRQRA